MNVAREHGKRKDTEQRRSARQRTVWLQLRTDTAINPMTCPSVDVSRAAVMMRRIIMYMQYSIPQNVNVMKN